MYLRDQAIAYPPGLYISRATDIKMVADKVSLCLPIWDVAKKNGFKLYYIEDMPTRNMKVEIVNFPHNWRSQFNGKQLIHTLKTLWNLDLSLSRNPRHAKL